MQPVFLVFLDRLNYRHFIDVFDSREAAENGIERDRDNCGTPPDLTDYEIIEAVPKGRAG